MYKVCAYCGTGFNTYRTEGKFCSTGCGHAAKRVRFVERFWSYVERHGPNECWPWTGGRNRRGYGKFWIDGRTSPAHRVAYDLTNGPMPACKYACHSCDNPPCCNPDHVWPGTAKDNQEDCAKKGRRPDPAMHWSKTNPEKLSRGDRHWTRQRTERMARGAQHWTHRLPERLARGERNTTHNHPEITAGERNGRATISEADVRQIRIEYKSGTRQSDLAQRFNMTQTQISRIVRRESWKHVA